MAKTESGVSEAGAPTYARPTALAWSSDLTRQAFRILHVAFIAAPTIAGLDKFFGLLTNWDRYLAPPFARLLGGHTFMLVVGVVEIAAGLLVAIKPKIGAYVVAAWLAGIIVNLLVLGQYYDVALRDFGLMLGALALARLATAHEQQRRPSPAV